MIQQLLESIFSFYMDSIIYISSLLMSTFLLLTMHMFGMGSQNQTELNCAYFE